MSSNNHGDSSLPTMPATPPADDARFHPELVPVPIGMSPMAAVPALNGVGWAGPMVSRPPLLTAGPDPLSLWNSLRRRWALALGVGMLVAASTMAMAWFVVPADYEASSVFRISPRPPSLMQDERFLDPNEYANYRRTQGQLIKSQKVLFAALQNPDVSQLPMVRSQSDAMRWLEQALVVTMPGDAEILRLSLRGEDPNQIERIVQAVQDAYMSKVVSAERDEKTRLRDSLRQIYNTKESELVEVTKRWQQLAEQLQTTDAGNIQAVQRVLLDRLAVLRQQKTQLQTQKLAAEAKKLKAQADIERAERSGVPDLMVDEQLMRDFSAQSLLRMKQTIEEDYLQYSTSSSADRPSIAAQRLKAQLEKISGQLEEKRDQIKLKLKKLQQDEMIGSLRADYQSAEAEEKKIQELLDEVVTNLEADSKRAQELVSNSADVESLKGKMEELKRIKQEQASRLALSDAEANAGQRVTLQQEASVPNSSDFALKYFLVGFAGLSALVVAVGGVTYFEFLGRRIDSTSQLADGLGMSVVGTLPAVARLKRGSANGAAGSHAVAIQGMLVESIDSVRTHLIHRAATRPTQLIMVTSAMDGEGKTTVASQLAASLARCGRRTLLVDADLRRPTAHRLFEIPLADGLSEVLRGEIGVDEAIRPTRASGLWMIPAGHYDFESVQALAKETAHEIFQSLREKFDFVIIDTGPVLTFADPLLLGQHIDTAILSVMRDRSQAPKVYEACERLRAVGINLFGTVVNGASDPATRRVYQARLRS